MNVRCGEEQSKAGRRAWARESQIGGRGRGTQSKTGVRARACSAYGGGLPGRRGEGGSKLNMPAVLIGARRDAVEALT